MLGESAQAQNAPDVPEVVVLRLPQYLRVLSRLLDEGMEVASSQQLGERLQMTPAQIRKDLSYFGRFGKQGRGYNVRYLLAELRQILSLNQEWQTALVGVGRLGRAIIEYPGFSPQGFRVVVAFDADSRQVGQTVGEVTIQSISQMAQVIQKGNIRIGIVAVPAEQAQSVVDHMVDCGIRAILNYAPVSCQVPPGVKVRNIDPVLALQSMTYYLRPLASPLDGRTIPPSD